MHFSDRLAKAVMEKHNPTVMGLDPKLEFIPDHVRARAAKVSGNAFQAAAESIAAFNFALIDAAADVIAVVKPQLAYYECYGADGLRAFDLTSRYAREKGLIVIADGKRNDIGSTAEAYSGAYLGRTVLDGGALAPVFDADALTVNGYLGTDGIKPFLNDCDAYGKGIFVLVKTSNPSSGQLQDMKLEDGRAVCEMMADLVNDWGAGRVGDCGYGSVGAVVGATYPRQLEEMRARMPRAWILVPGYGAQGGTAKDVSRAFGADGLGAVINASRSLMCAWQKESWKKDHRETEFAAATRAEAIRMRDDIMDALGNR
jgi:orotidine-5'-phosphate decarboxylase